MAQSSALHIVTYILIRQLVKYHTPFNPQLLQTLIGTSTTKNLAIFKKQMKFDIIGVPP